MTATTSGTAWICIACAIDGVASMSTSPTRNRPSNSPDSEARSSASWPLSGIRVREKKTSSTGALIDASTVAWKFSSLIVNEYDEPPAAAPGPPAGVPAAAPAGGGGVAGRLRADRSIAPGRENGCCVMRPV